MRRARSRGFPGPTSWPGMSSARWGRTVRRTAKGLISRSANRKALLAATASTSPPRSSVRRRCIARVARPMRRSAVTSLSFRARSASRLYDRAAICHLPKNFGRPPLNLHTLLLERKAAGRHVTVGLIGAGKFGTMFLSQARLTEGMHVVGVADINVARARDQLETAGWPAGTYAAGALDEAVKRGSTHVSDDAASLIACDAIEVIVEATGVPQAGIRHA